MMFIEGSSRYVVKSDNKEMTCNSVMLKDICLDVEDARVSVWDLTKYLVSPKHSSQ